jgi:hypothetical protein
MAADATEKKSSNSMVIIFLIFLVLVLGGALVAGGIVLIPGYFSYKVDKAVENNAEEEENEEEEEEEDVEEDDVEDSQAGTISGSVGYPSDYIPEDMIVCAEEISSGDEYCEEMIDGDDFTYNKGYIVDVPYGDYYVYASIPGDTYRAYYSEFVPCGLSVDCPSHDPISVTVDSTSNELTGIDPIDWYN